MFLCRDHVQSHSRSPEVCLVFLWHLFAKHIYLPTLQRCFIVLVVFFSKYSLIVNPVNHVERCFSVLITEELLQISLEWLLHLVSCFGSMCAVSLQSHGALKGTLQEVILPVFPQGRITFRWSIPDLMLLCPFLKPAREYTASLGSLLQCVTALTREECL